MIKIPILTATYFDLRKFDFNFAGIGIMKVGTTEFTNYCKKFLSFNGDDSEGALIKDYIKSIKESGIDKFAIVAIDPNKKYDYSKIYGVFEILLIIYPCDLQIQHELKYDGEDLGTTLSTWQFRYTGDYPGNFLYDKEDVGDVNEVIRHYFNSIEKDTFVRFMIENYMASFEVSHYHLQYINLCICLEAVIADTNDLNYRLRRTVAILCAENSRSADLIFANLKIIYNLRSRIVHGEKYDYKKVIEFLPFLQAIVSRTIIELLLHGITSQRELDKKITTLGFGDRARLSDQWKEYNINLVTLNKANYSELKAK